MEPYRPNCYKIPELNGLRVLLVFIVSWYHFWQQSWLTSSIGSYSLDYLLRAGYMPVDGTILLSGFLLFLPYARAMLLGEAVPNTKQFYQRRIMRIVPSYYFVTLALLFAVALPWHLYYNSSDMVRDVVMHLTFTQTFNPATYIATPIGVASWTIAIEMQAYLIFPLLARWAMNCSCWPRRHAARRPTQPCLPRASAFNCMAAWASPGSSIRICTSAARRR